MTVSYQSDVASSTSGGLIRLLWRWRGSVWKLVYKELIMFQMAFLFLQIVYNYVLIDPYKDVFKWIVILCSGFVDMIPLSFILGFYISFIANRWWNQYTAIPWPDRLMNCVAMYIPGNDETSRMLRRTLMRYANLSLILVLRSISIAVKRRFPTRDHIIEAGFMSKVELDIFSSVPSNEFNTFWIPCTWFVSLLREARQDCRITDSCGLKQIMEELNEFRNRCGLLWSFNWVSIPLVYTQVVTVATYCFFIALLFGRQHIDSPYPKVFTDGFQHKGERFIPVFSMIQFCLYMGLLKLGEQLINPFGDDDEDFELNWIIDRHIKVSLLGVDVLNSRPPPLTKDTYFGEADIKLPYTAAAVNYKKKTYRGSIAAYHVPSEQQGLVLPEFDEDYNEDDYYFSNTLQSQASKGQSLWSIFGGHNKNKQQSASLLSLDSNRSENLSELNDWQGSIDSYMMENRNDAKDEMFFGDEEQYPKLMETSQFECVDTFPEFEEVSELKQPKPQVLKAKSVLTKQSSQEESPLNQLTTNKPVETRKISDTPSYSSSILKNRSTSNSPNRVSSHFEVQFGSKAVPSSSSKIVETIKKTEKKTTSFFKSTKERDETRSDGRPSISSLKKNEVKMKTSLFKKADPKLRIKPFKSKVTFSDEPQRTSKADESSGTDRQTIRSSLIGTEYTIPDHKSTLTIHLDKYDLSASSPELNKASTSGKFPYSRHKLRIDKTESEDRLMNIRMTTGSSASVVTASELSELFSKLPIETLLQLGLPSNQSSQSSEQKLGMYSDHPKQLNRALNNDTPKVQTSVYKLKNEIPETYLHKPDVNRRKSFQLQSSQTPIEMRSEYDINCQENFKSDSNGYWLRHRSLPNIQEIVEDSGSENPSSPTSKETNNKFVTPPPLESTGGDHRAVSTKIVGSESVHEHLKDQLAVREDSELTSEQIKHNAQERRTLYSKASKSSSSSNQSSSSLQRKCRKKIPILLSSTKTNNFKQSSTDSDSSYYTAHSVHITIPEMEALDSIFQETSNESIGSTRDMQLDSVASGSTHVAMTDKSESLRKGTFHTSNESNYHSASEIFKKSNDNLNGSTQSASTDAGTIPTIVVLPTSPVTSEEHMFFGPTDQDLQQDRRRRLMEHFHMQKEKSDKNLLYTERHRIWMMTKNELLFKNFSSNLTQSDRCD